MDFIIPKPLMHISVFEKFFAYCEIAKGEIGGLGQVEEKDGFLIVKDIFLIPQHTTDALNTFDPRGHADFIRQKLEEGINPNAFRLWWHSHSMFQVSWSVTDESNILRLTKRTPLLSIVGNKYRDLATRYDVPLPERYSVHNFPIGILGVGDRINFTRRQLQDEVAKKVTYTPPGKKETKWQKA